MISRVVAQCSAAAVGFGHLGGESHHAFEAGAEAMR
jgi:hypothetical protein